MEERLTGWLLAILVVIVAIGWAVVFVAMPAVRTDFDPPPEVNIAMMGVLGAVVTIWRKSRKPDNVPPSDEEDE